MDSKEQATGGYIGRWESVSFYERAWYMCKICSHVWEDSVMLYDGQPVPQVSIECPKCRQGHKNETML